MIGEVRELTLALGAYEEDVLHLLKKKWILRFKLGPDCFAKDIRLFTNYPKEGDKFERSVYRELPWKWTSSKDKTTYNTELTMTVPGSFHYIYTCSLGVSGDHPLPKSAITLSQESVGAGYFLVDPELRCKGEELPLDSIVCQTVLSKLLGPLTSWRDRLEVAVQSGYNMVHFTPIQTLGDSQSAYSLCDQHNLNVSFHTGDCKATFKGVEEVVMSMRDDWGVLSICDIVLNHTANNTGWLKDHPDATYNLTNSPHLRPAFLLDRCIKRLARDIGDGLWEKSGIPQGEVSTNEHIEICRHLLENYYLPKAKISELYLADVEGTVAEFTEIIKGELQTTSDSDTTQSTSSGLNLIQDPEYRRHCSTVDLKLAVSKYNLPRDNINQEDGRVAACVAKFRNDLVCANSLVHARVMKDLSAALTNVARGATYQHVDIKGPRQLTVGPGENEEFVAPYFTCPDLATLEEEFALAWAKEGSQCMAHNGWVMGDDPLKNFALPGSQVYLRRELVAWGDSVKLRFGDCPTDSPFLWNYMKEYVVQTATIFDGLRLDNCHSTPIHVASYMLDEARHVKPDLYVSAELFTGSENKDNIFVNKLGITSLIREGLAAWDSHELGRMVHKYGGRPVGSFKWPSSTAPLAPGTAHALFMDWTHDNPSPVEKRTVKDMLPSAGLVSMASCANGSNRGYDELVPHHIHVVNEKRKYAGWNSIGPDTGMIKARKELSHLHQRLSKEGFSEVFVDQLNRDVVAVTRHCPLDRRSVVMVAHTAFFPGNTLPTKGLTLEVEGKLKEILFQGRTVHLGEDDLLRKNFRNINKEEDQISGLEDWRVEVISNLEGGGLVKILDNGRGDMVKLDLSDLSPGSLVILAIDPQDVHKNAINGLRNLNFSNLKSAVNKMDLLDVQFALFQCDQEGQESGFGTYSVPNFGTLKYCGLAGVVPILNGMRPNNDLGHPLAGNLRDGDWLLDYILSRLDSKQGTKALSIWLRGTFGHLRCLPRYLIPRYFDSVIMEVYGLLQTHTFSLMSPFVQSGSDFIRRLAMGGVIHTAVVSSANLPPASTSQESPSPTLAAGLPHFSTGYMRSWGRDTFISLRGTLLITGRFVEAKNIILGYAATLRHGLIPNLLDGGKNARYNCRDAIWWWLRALLDYIHLSKDEGQIMSAPVQRLWPNEKGTEKSVQPLQDVIHEALSVHVRGLSFREHNAGKKIDEHMQDEGFNNHIGVDPDTGFVFGGNTYNCGTWMDKMGSSDEAGNKGVPSSPRDGSAVEIVALCYSCLLDLASLGEAVYTHQTVDGIGTLLQWTDKIKINFDKHFWVPDKMGAVVEPYPDLVNCVQIYKDSLGSGGRFTDYQLRPNYAVALAVAPSLSSPEKAWSGLKTMGKRLQGPLGLATLDSEDWAYRGNYDNSNQSSDKTIAHGANYHQGPEWVWPVGFYLRALLSVSKLLGKKEQEEAAQTVSGVLSKHYEHLSNSSWLGLPELTNRAGNYCNDSNPIQAWSMATVLDTLYDMDSF